MLRAHTPATYGDLRVNLIPTDPVPPCERTSQRETTLSEARALTAPPGGGAGRGVEARAGKRYSETSTSAAPTPAATAAAAAPAAQDFSVLPPHVPGTQPGGYSVRPCATPDPPARFRKRSTRDKHRCSAPTR